MDGVFGTRRILSPDSWGELMRSRHLRVHRRPPASIGRPAESGDRIPQGNRFLGVTGARLRDDLQVPEQDLAAACAYLVGEGLITVDWAQGNTPAMVTLTHQGIRLMEAEEEERG